MLMQNFQIFQGLSGKQQYFSLCQRPLVGSDKQCTFFYLLYILHLKKEESYNEKVTEWMPIFTYTVESFSKMLTFFG